MPTRSTATPARRRLRPVVIAAGTAVLVVAWLALAPAVLGGSATYVTTVGSSMEPLLHPGDLVVVRERSSYRVGDVVAYRSESLHSTVLHRIVGREGDRFVLQGDNNQWIDADRPSRGDVLGTMSVRVPGAGKHVDRLSSPPVVATLAGTAALPAGLLGRRRRRGRTTSKTAAHRRRATPKASSWDDLDPRLLALTATTVAILALGFTKPSTVDAAEELPFEDRGAFSYVGSAPGSAEVYETGQATSGQPVFLSLVQRLEVSFTFHAHSDAPDLRAEGSMTLAAVLSDVGGWSHRVVLADRAAVQDGRGTASGTLDLQDLRRLIEHKEQVTGVARDSYTLTLESIVSREIVHRGGSSAGTFVARAPFEMSHGELRLSQPGPDALEPRQGGLVSTQVDLANEIRLLGRSAPIAVARAVGVASALLVAAAWFDRARRLSSGDEHARIAHRYGGLIVPVRALAVTEGATEVASMAALVKLAQWAGAPILRCGNVYEADAASGPVRYLVHGGEGE